MANSRTRASRKGTPSGASSRSRTPQRKPDTPLPIRASTSRRPSRLTAVKNSSPQDSEMDSEDEAIRDTYLSRRMTQTLKEVRVPTSDTNDRGRAKAPIRSPSTTSSGSVEQQDGLSNYETPGTSAVNTPANGTAGKSRRLTRGRSALMLDGADDDKENCIVVSSSAAKGKRKMSDRELMEEDDSALAEKMQRAEYAKLDSLNPGSKRQRVVPDSDTSSMLSDPEDVPDSESDDIPLVRSRASRLTNGESATKPNATDIEENATESEYAQTENYTDSDAQQSFLDDSEAEGARLDPQGKRAAISDRLGSHGKIKLAIDGVMQDARKKAPASGRFNRDNAPGEYFILNPYERGQYRLAVNHPELRTLWEDLEKVEIVKPERLPQPAGLSRQLKPFQLEGLDWMRKQEKTHYHGGLLGDEMGMGKTIQAVALIMSDYETTKEPTLVVVPPVALVQWSSEIASYTDGKLKVLIHHNMDSKVKKLTIKDMQKYNVILISYSGLESLYRKESKGWTRGDGLVKENSKIHAMHFHRLILDEAHNIKQRTTGVAKACFALKADFKWCLSGTPVQNRIGEFFSLLRFLEVKPFACYFCKECGCRELHWQQDQSKRCAVCHHTGFQHIAIFNQELLNPITRAEDSITRREALRKLRLITDRIMLRRLKRDHTASMELPPKEVVIHNEFFGDVERDFSSSIMTNTSRQFDTYVSRGVMLNNYANIFGLIMQMRQVANHPDLILKKRGEQGQNVLVCCICDEPAEEAIRSRCHHEFCRKCARDYVRSYEYAQADAAGASPECPRCHIPLSIDFDQPDIEQDAEMVKKTSIINRIKMEHWTSSTKIEMLVYDLWKLRSDKQTHKSIVFSQFTSMLQLVEWRLRRAGFNTVMLDGSMTPAQRSKSIDYFMNNVDVEVFLVSLKAGGVALNLTEASRVFIVDPWWNPAAEYQSADRCHRIGQRRPCIVKRLVIEDSVESRMVLLQEKKAHMIAGTVDNDDVAIDKLTPEDMSFLFRGS